MYIHTHVFIHVCPAGTAARPRGAPPALWPAVGGAPH